jgi:hypothetical protein
MKNKLSCSFLVLLLISCSTQTNSNTKQGSVSLEKNAFDFGTISNADIQSIPITIRNTSPEKIEIVDISKSCGCTEIDLKKRFINSTSNLSFNIKYDPKDDMGKVNRSVVLRLSNNDFLVFKFKGIIIN